ncbi:fibroblast growth factor receptor-like 1 [Uloborus diversus]|uniref:fibroblast growth factor receptor-like 1 n=1 Tax=Uloborus diversus TaxID=327109 RepID=UPI002409F781|nr:fibroblast growth factor receptor-like 1 [Uloborus diversus]
MWSSFKTFSCVFVVLSFVEKSSAQSPPQLIPNLMKDQHIVRPGLSITLDCPVKFAKDIIYEWYKGRESIVNYATQTLRILNNGALRIKETVFDDTGIYKCRAVNGFGSLEFNTTLLVVGTDEDYEQYGDSWDVEEMDDSKINLPYSPVLLWVNEANTSISKRPGVSFRLQCVSIGSPKPVLTWYKDGRKVTNLPTTRWALIFRKALARDSGNYTCMASNRLGNVSHAFNLIIDEGSKGKPILTGENITVQEGQQAVLECAVQSTSFPHIQWLKQVQGDEILDGNTSGPLQFEGEFFNVIQSTFSVDYFLKDGYYHYKLIIDNAQISDSGKYVCLGANHHGYEYRFSFLYVVPKDSFQSQIPFPIVVAAIVVCIAAAAGIIGLLLYCRPRQRQTRLNKDDFIPMHYAQCAPSEMTHPKRSTKMFTYVEHAST